MAGGDVRCVQLLGARGPETFARVVGIPQVQVSYLGAVNRDDAAQVTGRDVPGPPTADGDCETVDEDFARIGGQRPIEAGHVEAFGQPFAPTREGIRAAGGTPMEVNTISISDGISMGTEGMKASLISREVIADSIELCGIGYSFDACVIIVGCDKTIPAGAMALLAHFVADVLYVFLDPRIRY